MELDINRSNIFLLYFYETYDVILREKKFGLSAAYSAEQMSLKNLIIL